MTPVSFDIQATHRQYAKAFREYGIDVLALTPDEAASQLSARDIRQQLADALDHWAIVRGAIGGNADEVRQRLLNIARHIDGDPWRNQVRDAWIRGDEARLTELAEHARVRDAAPAMLVHLAQTPSASGESDSAAALLEQAQPWHPADFWINYRLAHILQLSERLSG